MVVVYSATTEYTKYICDLKAEINLEDSFIYKVNMKYKNIIIYLIFFCFTLYAVEGWIGCSRNRTDNRRFYSCTQVPLRHDGFNFH